MTPPSRLIYLSNARVPSEKANTKQSMSQCEAFGRLFTVEFWYPHRRNPITSDDPYAFYGVDRTFSMRPIRCWDSVFLRELNGRLGFFVQAVSYLAVSSTRLLAAPKGATIYTRNQFDVFVAPLFKAVRPDLSMFFEDHDGVLERMSSVKKPFLAAVCGIVVTTTAHADALVRRGIPRERILVCPNGVSQKLASAPVRQSKRPDTARVVYAGNLFAWKGVYVLAQAAALLPESYRVEFIGGSPEATGPFMRHLQAIGVRDRVIVRGPIRPTEVPAVLADADVLVLPNSSTRELSHSLTSPLKLFEYMAAGRPIVATDVPALTSLLKHRWNAIIVEPDNPEALAAGVRLAFEDHDLAAQIARQAKSDVAEFTWERRAEYIGRFLAQRGARVGRRDITCRN